MSILKENNLFEALHETLNDYNLTVDHLRSLKHSEFDALCKELDLTTIQTLKLRHLMTIIRESNDTEDGKEDMELKQFLDGFGFPSKVYDALIDEGIGFKTLETITPNDIDQLCDEKEVQIGMKVKLKNVIEQHQLEALKQKFSTPGAPVYAERAEKKEEGAPFDHEMKVGLIGDSGGPLL